MMFEQLDATATEEVVALLGRVFRCPPGGKEWNWYSNGCPIGQSRVYAARDDRRMLLGVFAFQPTTVRMSGVNYSVSLAHHLAIHPQLRGGALYMKLCDFALSAERERGVKFVFGPPNQRAAVVHKTLTGWSALFEIERLVTKSISRKANPCEVLGAIPDGIEQLLEARVGEAAFAQLKSLEWLRWRYEEHPDRPYTILGLRDGKRCRGLVIMKRWTDATGYTKAHLIDIYADDEETATALVAGAIDYAVGCDELNMWCSRRSEWYEVFRRAGLSPMTGGAQEMLIHRLGGDAGEMSTDGRIYINLGDVDGY